MEDCGTVPNRTALLCYQHTVRGRQEIYKSDVDETTNSTRTVGPSTLPEREHSVSRRGAAVRESERTFFLRLF